MVAADNDTERNPVAARKAAMDLLARREHSRRELLRKLGRRFAPQVLEGALEQLVRDGLQSDGRFAESYVRHRSERGYGPLRLVRELRERGIDNDLADRAVAGADCDWSRLARRVADKKFGVRPPADRRELARRLRFLHYRGFDTGALDDPWGSGLE
ncbi:regulatory protein RecX [Pseudohaliea rubra]|uniref:Regulatory protein RecX n=1 Tax=Pseudohaliea rubra DSM 19751 TaxID=1265313 RepID=A0A095VVK6_9GAMM|nr:regulatory protein RecX [Pseudohaliea rubra]KGE05053.1 Regulatory protein RecX [Pseudohaliea rubra DSM 19751]